ncbi:U3 small nucleolar ribonucleo MPP10 isoform X2 [Olea europaea subsp. europaea]|uniref:U3 small nucleolar ribonucleo MPP10 isoform X2 n=1 Tax=Olea europaea subsp. europaea TaxID=158383 RepID=A0A8S0TQD7_OLEEU|nr:U3 small nucleolar ribonucleo MPP10 isoform X2 [Olea europaea subsp. europaea]
MGLDDEEEEGNKMENARYEEFFGGKRTGQGKKPKVFGRSNDSDMDYGNNNQKNTLSTHEKELEKLCSEIKVMEKENLDPKTWTMQGEVTAAKRPNISALEVDLDFEHNVRPAPVITEEVTASLEELIQKRILEGRFDDVQKPLTLPSKSPREKIELDENKSEKGLAELYEDEYVQKTGLVSTVMSFKDEQKKEASMLFKKLCLKLDAPSHFHITPKPVLFFSIVIEDMSMQANVPALAMEEINSLWNILAVSDAAMLAPEELFAGKGDVKEETELTKAERKRRRANKKRKFKAEATKRMARKAQQNSASNNAAGNEEL